MLGKIEHPELAVQLYDMVYERISAGDKPSASEIHLWLDEQLPTTEERADCAIAAADITFKKKQLAQANKRELFDANDMAAQHNMDTFLLLYDVFENIFDRLLASM